MDRRCGGDPEPAGGHANAEHHRTRRVYPPANSSTPRSAGPVQEGFRLQVSGQFGQTYELLASPDSVTWAKIGEVVTEYGIAQFTEPWAGYSTRCYRGQEEAEESPCEEVGPGAIRTTTYLLGLRPGKLAEKPDLHPVYTASNERGEENIS